MAKRVAERREVQFEGDILTVALYQSPTVSAADPYTVEVHDIPDNLHKDRLELYFENKRNGGGDIKQIDINMEKKVAYIKYSDKQGLCTV